MHHKRKRHRKLRAGCKLCKPWKVNGVNKWHRDFAKASDYRNRLEQDFEPHQEIPPDKPIPRKKGPRNIRVYPVPPAKRDKQARFEAISADLAKGLSFEEILNKDYSQ
jgi:hypothetical protein